MTSVTQQHNNNSQFTFSFSVCPYGRKGAFNNIVNNRVLVRFVFGFWFLTEVTMKCRPAPMLKLCQSPLPGHCCNSRIIHGASPRPFPYITVCKLTQPVLGYTALDTALELGLRSDTGKLIPLLLDTGTSSCTRLAPPTDGIFPHLAHSHTCVTAQV